MLLSTAQTLGKSSSELSALFKKAAYSIDSVKYGGYERYARVWIDYATIEQAAEGVEKARAVFQVMTTRKIGHLSATFYESWSGVEKLQSPPTKEGLQRALEVVETGIQKGALPKTQLRKLRDGLQATLRTFEANSPNGFTGTTTTTAAPPSPAKPALATAPTPTDDKNNASPPRAPLATARTSATAKPKLLGLGRATRVVAKRVRTSLFSLRFSDLFHIVNSVLSLP
jgi:hypothetical protein